MSRPTKKPSKKALSQWGHLTYIFEKTRKILDDESNPIIDLGVSVKKGANNKPQIKGIINKIPRRYDDESVGLILHVLTTPSILRYDEKAVKWARLFSQDSGGIISALPKILKLMNKFCNSSGKRVIWYFSLQNDMRKYGLGCKGDFYDKFWDEKEIVLADMLSKSIGGTFTAKTIQHARDNIRKAVKFPPKSSKK